MREQKNLVGKKVLSFRVGKVKYDQIPDERNGIFSQRSDKCVTSTEILNIVGRDARTIGTAFYEHEMLED